jgi:signal peptidase I
MTTDKPAPQDEQTSFEAQEIREKKEPDDIVELVKAMLVAAVIALTVRTFAFEPFNIPSGSMLPSLLVGDYLFVEKYSYGYSRYSFPFDLATFEGRFMERKPQRGDVAVFRQPKKPHIDYIKRLIGLPGDTIQVKDGILHINGEPVRREFKGTENYRDDTMYNVYNRYIETLPNGVQHYIYELSDYEHYDNTPEYKVPEGFYFAMGDNRDSSLDSRAQEQVGFVPADNLVGRALFLFFSTEGTGATCEREGFLAAVRRAGCKLVEWPQAIRYSRILKRVHSL